MDVRKNRHVCAHYLYNCSHQGPCRKQTALLLGNGAELNI